MRNLGERCVRCDIPGKVCKMQVSVSKLTSHIRKIVTDLIREGSTPKSVKKANNLSPAMVDALMEIVGPMIDAEYTRAALLMRGAEIGDSCKGCLPVTKLKRAKVLGRGYNGTVFDIGGGHALKVESLSQQLVPVGKDGKLLERGRANDSALDMLGASAQRMGELGIGPKVYGWKVCACPRTAVLAVEMDKIEGRTLTEFVRDKKTTPSQMTKVRNALIAKLEKMHAEGLVHADFHHNNVLVDRKSEPWIVDFSMVFKLSPNSKGSGTPGGRRIGRGIAKNHMEDNLAMARDLKRGAHRRIVHDRPDKIRLEVLARLVERGAIKVTGAEDDPGMRFAMWGTA